VDVWSHAFSLCFWTAIGSFNVWTSGAGPHCGNGEHAMAGLLHGAVHTQVDYDHCEYLLMFGCGNGAGAYYNATLALRAVSERKARGMRVVVLDPMLSPSAERADEWQPIRPGTDAFVALAMLNCLINEFGIFDAEHLRAHTNGAYLIGEDGRYVRDEKSAKPLVWDGAEQRPKPFDDPGLREAALLGTYTLPEGARTARPAFQCLAEHVRKYTAEEAEKVSTVPGRRSEGLPASSARPPASAPPSRSTGAAFPIGPSASSSSREPSRTNTRCIRPSPSRSSPKWSARRTYRAAFSAAIRDAWAFPPRAVLRGNPRRAPTGFSSRARGSERRPRPSASPKSRSP
jgi:molybdopterin-containing oxidoreductase family molybdopterin binding subunit